MVYRTTVTGICYVPLIRTIWIAAGTVDVPMFDPKSGDNVSIWSLYILCTESLTIVLEMIHVL